MVDIALRLEGFAGFIVVVRGDQDFAVADADAGGPDAAGQKAEEVVTDVDLARFDRLGPVERAKDELVGEGVFEVASVNSGGLVAELADRPVDHLGAGGGVGERQVKHNPSADQHAEHCAGPDQECPAGRLPFEITDPLAAGGVHTAGPSFGFCTESRRADLCLCPLLIEPHQIGVLLYVCYRARKWFVPGTHVPR